jgi:hypothetical protein
MDYLKRKIAENFELQPTPKQEEFLACEELETLLVGERGSGKTTALLLSASQYISQPNYRALVLCPTMSIISNCLHRSAHRLFARFGKWNERSLRWSFQPGARIDFGYGVSLDDFYKYAGSEYQFIGFDEMKFTDIKTTEHGKLVNEAYGYMASRLRITQEKEIPLRLRATIGEYRESNSATYDWVSQYFWLKNDGRKAIFAGMADNPYLLRA